MNFLISGNLWPTRQAILGWPSFSLVRFGLVWGLMIATATPSPVIDECHGE
jgi:hypothetical protein